MRESLRDLHHDIIQPVVTVEENERQRQADDGRENYITTAASGHHSLSIYLSLYLSLSLSICMYRCMYMWCVNSRKNMIRETV